MGKLGLSTKHTLSYLTNLIILSLAAISVNGQKNDHIFLSHDQYAVTYDGANKNDIVGVWDPWYPTEDTTSGVFGYSLIDSKDGTYDINSTTGVVTIKDNTKLKAGTDVLIVRTSLQGKHQDYKLFITVKATADCIFIDPSASSNGTGSRLKPFNSWKSAKFSAGKAFLQKRGTTWKSTIIINSSGSSGNEIYIGAYGIGKRPVISVDTTSVGISCNGSYVNFFELHLTGNRIGLYKGHGGTTEGLKIYTDLLFSDLEFEKNYTENGQLYMSLDFSSKEWPDYKTWERVKILDVSAHGSKAGYGIKIEGGNGARFENVKTYNNAGHGISLTWGTIADTIVGLLSYGNKKGAGIEMSGRKHSLSYSIVRAEPNTISILVDDPGSSNTIIHHNIIEGGHYKGAIVLSAYSTQDYIFWDNIGYGFIIEDNIISKATTNRAGIAIYYGVSDVTIQRNIIKDCYIGIDIGRLNTSVKNIGIYNNAIYGISNISIKGSGGSNIDIYHNTIDGSIDLSNTQSEEVRNNYFKSLQSADNYSNNIDIDTIDKNAHFYNFDLKDFRLKSTAVSAINKGFDSKTDVDFLLASRKDSPDIGAYEFQDGEDDINVGLPEDQDNEPTEEDTTDTDEIKPPIENNAPVMEDMVITISESSFTGNIIGRITAIDPDAGQTIHYSIISGNHTGMFVIDNLTGEIKTTSSKIFGPGTLLYSIVVQAIDNAIEPKSVTADVTVKLIGKSTAYYIDPENKNDDIANGSIDHPFASWNDVVWKNGYTYLQKRGTATTIDKILIGANDVTLGAYGEGDLPIISSNTSTYLISGFEKAGITIRELNLQAPNAVSSIYFLGNAGDSIVVEHCQLNASVNAIKVANGNTLVVRYNSISSHGEGVYSSATDNQVYYNIFKNCQEAINIMGNSAIAKIYNNVFYNNDESLSVTYADLTLYNNIFYLNSPGQSAIHHGTGNIQSNNNIYYPEQAGFITIASTVFNNLQQLQQAMNIDMNSFISDPAFVDMYNENFLLAENSPAINAGVDLNLGTDLLGSSVPLSGAADIGVHEFTGVIAPQNDPNYQSLRLYPNPSTGKFNILAELQEEFNNPQNESSEIKVIDLSGKTVFSRQIVKINESTYHEQVDLTGIANGMYFVVLEIAGKLLKEKLLINN